jgi:hypothetical protein
MKAGHLSEYFTGVAAKKLSAVEADLVRSHQHEFNGVEGLKRIFGQAAGKQTFNARFIYLNDHDDEPVVADGFLTWYDAREKHASRSEHRLYFPTTSVSLCAAEGDVLVIGRRPDGSGLVVIAESNSTIANQVQWLFGLTNLTHPGFSIREELESEQDRVEFAARFILENIGIVVETHEESFLDAMLTKFGGTFPTTKEFSDYSRSTLKDVSALDDPDAAVITWMEREEILFRTLERHIIADRLTKGFTEGIDDFIGYSLSVQNRRKSRVGRALENHLEVVFAECGIRYSRTAVTENKAKPDFLFPGAVEYQDPQFEAVRLTMLGVKSTCKDRWRQVLAEADRIKRKHLLTLETAISKNQTDEMEVKGLQLIVPLSLQRTYTKEQQSWLMSVENFASLVKQRQESC